MKRIEMIKEKKYFNSIIKKGKFVKNKYFVVYYIYNNENDFTHFGIAIKNSFGNAVERNRIKRQTRNIIDENKKVFKNNCDYIIMIRNGCINAKYEDLSNAFTSLVEGI